uniref:Isoform 2 of Cystatin-D n=1 Tax=Mus musculus TaxID=10090 RepID=Q9JM84-2
MASLLSPSMPVLAAVALTLTLAVIPEASTNAEAKQVVLGGVEPADPKDKEVQKVVKFAVRTYNDMDNDLYLSKPIRLMSASQQRVICNFQINVAPWLNKMSMTNFNCYNF